MTLWLVAMATQLAGDAQMLSEDESIQHPHDVLRVVGIEKGIQTFQDVRFHTALIEVRRSVLADFQRYKRLVHLTLQNLTKAALS